MEQVKRNFADSLAKIHGGAASSSLVEDVRVDYYNQKLPLKQLASVTVADPTTVVVTPWDKGSATQIEAALKSSGHNFTVANDGKVVRVVLPPLTAERRQEIVKLVARLAEEAKIALRQVREESWRQVKQQVKDGKLTEDDRYRAETELNKLIASFNDELAAAAQAKERSLSQ